MKITPLCLLLLAFVALAAAQSPDELHIPVENDNQFPPDNNVEGGETIIEGSGAGDPIVEDPDDVAVTTEHSPPPPLEDVQLLVSDNIEPTANETGHTLCPKPCVCHVEGEDNSFVVDCSGYGLQEFPTPIDSKATTLNIQNNKLTEIPKEVSLLKNLKVLNANNNSIFDLVSGSVSELPLLTVLKLGNNRLVEYPQDLKNSFGLNKLEELDLGGNDMRTSLNRETFSHFTALKKLTLPTGAKELVEDLCASMKNSLATVCTESCNTQLFECPDAPQDIDADLLNVVSPGTIALSSVLEENVGPAAVDDAKIEAGIIDATEVPELETKVETTIPSIPETKADPESAIRSAINKAPDGILPLSAIVEAPKASQESDNHKEPAVAVGAPKASQELDNHKEPTVAVGATTSGKSGGVDKSIIGMIVAGMVLVVAGITIKKNWSSIRNRFSSSPRAANERSGAHTNGTTPAEEVPLQEKLPV